MNQKSTKSQTRSELAPSNEDAGNDSNPLRQIGDPSHLPTPTTSGGTSNDTTTVAASHGLPENPYKAISAAEQALQLDLLTECKRLTALMDCFEEDGYYFWPHVEGLAREGFDGKCGICTNGAKLIARKFHGFVAGYEIGEKDPQTLAGAIAGGHDFAVVGPFIVDWWAWEYDQSLDCPVILRSEGIHLGKYKPESAWEIFVKHDFTVSAS